MNLEFQRGEKKYFQVNYNSLAFTYEVYAYLKKIAKAIKILPGFLLMC